MNIALSKQLQGCVDLLVKSGRYRDHSDVVYAGLRALQKEEQSEPAWLETAIAKAIDSGPPVPADEHFWRDFDKRATARLKQPGK